jgi:hypothetical protein
MSVTTNIDKTMNIKYLDTCLLDYFQGFGGETFAVPLCRNMRSDAVLNGLHDEINGWSGYMGDKQATPKDYEALHEAADALFADLDLRRRWSEQAGEECYAYFGVLVEEEA